VDDELNLLEGLVRGLRRAFSLVTATGGEAAIKLLRQEPAFAGIMSDLRMPGMDGISLLRHARQIQPDAVRILFTGNADLSDAIEAVNEGSIFRFISKPCALPAVKSALDAAVEQHRLVTAERVLLEQTLQGSVKALTEVLAFVSPAAFGRATRARQRVGELASRCGVKELWPVEMAAMLSQLGCVTLPPEVLDKLYHGLPATAEEQAMIDRVPAVTLQLLSHIPRLDPVLNIFRYQHKRYNGEGQPEDKLRGDEIPWGARALKLIADLDLLETQSVPSVEALGILGNRVGWYDPAILAALSGIYGTAAPQDRAQEVMLREVKPGMVFAEDVKTMRGLLLIARGQEVTIGLMERIMNFSSSLGVKEPVRILLHEASSQAAVANRS
jgi:response regulator RpfG family c-di-GMP phosphodiesterase